ncbi:MAG: class I SAM-dependent methyltransferase [Burkholderiaceae bacterium]
MAIERNIPVNVSPEAAALLERAYALDGDEQSRALYRDWAETYDDTMLQGLGYRSPAVVARLLGEHLSDRRVPVLDIGCGTGLAGHKLGELGFTAIDGLDLSPEMMQVAARRNVYRNFIAADLNAPLPIADGSYSGASCSGTFTHGHVDARCLAEIFRVLRLGAPFAFTVKLEVWEPLGFKDTLAQLLASGRIAEVAMTHDRHYENSKLPDGVFCVYRRL